MNAFIAECRPQNPTRRGPPARLAWNFDGARRNPPPTHELPPFMQLQQAFEACGGLASGDHVAGLMRSFSPQPISQLARQIVARELVVVADAAVIWLPMFQFDRASMRPLAAVQGALTELRELLGDGDIARWFAQCNDDLEGVAPMQRAAQDPDAVIRAARCRRLAALGLGARA